MEELDKIAIMQPYVFPYLGYFQLMHSVDCFVYYDDVNFIKRGWINRNQILLNDQPKLFTVPLQQASQNKLIKDIQLVEDNKWRNDFLKTLEQAYKKAPFVSEVLELVSSVIADKDAQGISALAMCSVEKVKNYLGLDAITMTSSEKFGASKGMEKADRLIEISKQIGASIYINPSGGRALYTKPYFEEHGLALYFIKNQLPEYSQFKIPFHAGLSIIDVLMFNAPEDVIYMMEQYTLE
jgi:hypothetical protein